MSFLISKVQTAFNPFTTVRNIIRASTLLTILLTIVICITIGVLVGTGKINGFVEDKKILIYESNMSLILEQKRQCPYHTWSYVYPIDNYTQTNIAIPLNNTLKGAFSNSFLKSVSSNVTYLNMLSTADITRYNLKAKAFFNQTEPSDNIKDALKPFQPIVDSYDIYGCTYNGPATVNRVLSNVTDALETNLTPGDLPYVTVTNTTSFR